MPPSTTACPLLLVLLLGQPAPTATHSSLLIPPARNAVDKDLPPWRGGRFGANLSYGIPPDSFGCDCVNATADEGRVACEVGQSCLWFRCATPTPTHARACPSRDLWSRDSNGCSIGCPSCDGGNTSSPTGGANPSAAGTPGNEHPFGFP